jgi:ribosomal protein S18 acetylase RimI-like enzyme
MRTYIRPLGPLHYRSIKDIFTVFHKNDLKDKDLSYYWRHRSREASVGIFNGAGDLLGFALLMNKAETPGNMYLSFIAVHPAFKGLDLGSKLLKSIMAKRLAVNGSVHLVPLSFPKLRKWYYDHGFNFSRNCMNFHSHRTRKNQWSVDYACA